jgi:hypothetical protein
MRHARAIHLNIVTDDQYQDLVKVAQEPGDDAQSISVQLVNGLGTESTTDGTAGAKRVLGQPWRPLPTGRTRARARTRDGVATTDGRPDGLMDQRMGEATATGPVEALGQQRKRALATSATLTVGYATLAA